MLLAAFGSPAAVFAASSAALQRVDGVGVKIAAAIRENADGRFVDETLRVCERENVQIILEGDPDYPRLLATIPDPPPILFVRGAFAPAEIRIHPSGKFLYVANRIHDSIGGFRIGEDTKLTAIGQTPTENNPRSFDIDPDGRFLYAAGESSGNLATFSIDQKTGDLKRIATQKVGVMPWWVMTVRYAD